MREDEPRDPSLALCQICANINTTVMDEDMTGKLRKYLTCTHWITRDCNDFVPFRSNVPWRCRR